MSIRPTSHSADAPHSGLSRSEPYVWEDVLADYAAAPERWISATKLRNWIHQDPLLDWLDAHGRAAGFIPDDERPGYDSRLDFTQFVLEQGRRFEAGIMDLLKQRAEVVEITRGVDQYDITAFVETLNAMQSGAEAIAQGWLLNPDNHTFGAPDLLVRADVLERLFPGTLSGEDIAYAPPGYAAGHYRAVDIKFTTLELRSDGSAGSGLKAQAAQLWLYNQMLGAVQGYLPLAAFLLGRTWKSGSGKTAQRGRGAFERLARVELTHEFGRRAAAHDGSGRGASAEPLSELVAEGLAWRRRLAAEGASWNVRPEPSVIELWPNAGSQEDGPWHAAKRELIAELGELTQLPGVGVEKRNAAIATGITSWRDPRASAEALGVTSPAYGARCDAVLAANRIEIGSGPFSMQHPAGADGGPTGMLPARAEDFVHADPAWRTPAALEFYVDFETVSNLADDFSTLPAVGGQPLIFQIGCGIYEPTAAPAAVPAEAAGTRIRRWSFAQWTVDRLSEDEELRIIDAWIAHMAAELERRGLDWSDARIYHWSAAEVSTPRVELRLGP